MQSPSNLVVHAVFSTKCRRPLLTPSNEHPLHEFWRRKALRLFCRVVAVGSSDDHAHLLLRMPPTESVSHVVGVLKGAASHHWNEHPLRECDLYWQEGFYAVSCNPADLGGLIHYVENQRQHHGTGHIKSELELPQPEAGRATRAAPRRLPTGL